jgi:hypothetical protein
MTFSLMGVRGCSALTKQTPPFVHTPSTNQPLDE